MEYIKYIYDICKTFFTSVTNVLSYVYSMLTSLWYGITTMFSGLMDMITDLFSSGIFDELQSSFNYLSVFLGPWGTYFLTTILYISMLAIGFGFVFKLFKFDMKFKEMKTKRK